MKLTVTKDEFYIIAEALNALADIMWEGETISEATRLKKIEKLIKKIYTQQPKNEVSKN